MLQNVAKLANVEKLAKVAKVRKCQEIVTKRNVQNETGKNYFMAKYSSF